MDEPPSSTQIRPRRLAILCGAALAAAVFTPVPATAFAAGQPVESITIPIAQASPVHNALAEGLISTGMAGLVLAGSGLVYVTVRRRQY